MKKFFVITTFLLVVTLIFWGVYNFSFKKSDPYAVKPVVTPEEQKPSNTGGVFDIGKKENRILPFSKAAVLIPMVNKSSDKIYYHLALSGKINGLKLSDLTEQIIVDEEIAGIERVIWSPQKTKAILKIKKDGKENFYLYDYEAKMNKVLKDGLDDVAWTDLGNQIVYKYYDGKTKERSLNVADPDGTNWKKIADIAFRRIFIAPVPKTPAVSFWNEPNAFEETSLQSVSVLGGETKKIFAGKFGADYKWSPDGEKLLITFSDAKGATKMNLGIANKNGGEFRVLDIPTLASKCLWSADSKSFYYAMIGAVPEGAVMPNDYLSRKVSTSDTFWKVDIESGKKERLVELAEMEKVGLSFDAENLLLAPEGDYLFFVNRKDGLLYRIEL